MNLLTEKPNILFRKYLIPSLLSAAAISIFQLVDMIAIGQGAGENGVAALSVVTPLFGITSFLGVFIGIGASVPMGISKGEKKTEMYSAYFTASLIMISVLTVLSWLILFFFSEAIYTFFGATHILMPLVKEYGDWIIGSFPFFVFSIYLACIVRVDEAPSVAMWAVAISGIFNVLGDYLLVFPFKIGTGMAGAAIATVLSNVIQVVIFVGYLLSKRCNLKLTKPFVWHTSFTKIFLAGFSTGFIDIAYISLTILLNNQVLKYGNEITLAVFGVAYTCSSTFQRVFCGVGQAVQPIVSTNLGAGKTDRIFVILKLSIFTELFLGIIFAGVGMLFPKQIVSLFMTASEVALSIAPGILLPIFLSLLFMGICMFVTYYFQSIMESLLATIIAMLRGIVLSGGLIILLPMFMDINGIWYGMFFTEVITFIIVMVCIAITKNKLKNKVM